MIVIEQYKGKTNIIHRGRMIFLLISYRNYQGGNNNLVVVESYGVITTSLKDKQTAIRTHKRKIKRLKAKQK
jgi:hypothetical protein